MRINRVFKSNRTKATTISYSHSTPLLRPVCRTLGRTSRRRSAYYVSNNAVLPFISNANVAVVCLHFPAPKFFQVLGSARLSCHLFSAVSTMRVSSPNSHTSALVVLATNGEHKPEDNDKDDGRYHQPFKNVNVSQSVRTKVIRYYSQTHFLPKSSDISSVPVLLVMVVMAVETSDMFARYVCSQPSMYHRDLATAVFMCETPLCNLCTICIPNKNPLTMTCAPSFGGHLLLIATLHRQGV